MGNEGMVQLFMSYEIIVLHSSAKRVFMFVEPINEFHFFSSNRYEFNEWDFLLLFLATENCVALTAGV